MLHTWLDETTGTGKTFSIMTVAIIICGLFQKWGLGIFKENKNWQFFSCNRYYEYIYWKKQIILNEINTVDLKEGSYGY